MACCRNPADETTGLFVQGKPMARDFIPSRRAGLRDGDPDHFVVPGSTLAYGASANEDGRNHPELFVVSPATRDRITHCANPVGGRWKTLELVEEKV